MLVSASGCSLPSTLSLSPVALVDTSLPPPRTCSSPLVLVPGCSFLFVLEDSPCPAPSLLAVTPADDSFSPSRSCPYPLVQVPGCSCSSVWKDALGLAPSPSGIMPADASLPLPRT